VFAGLLDGRALAACRSIARAVAWSLAPITLGHALSIGVVVLIVQLAQVALPMLHIRIGVAMTLVALGV
jgi:hypothetical protein